MHSMFRHLPVACFFAYREREPLAIYVRVEIIRSVFLGCVYARGNGSCVRAMRETGVHGDEENTLNELVSP